MTWKQKREDDQKWLEERFKEFKYYPRTRRVQIDGKHFAVDTLKKDKSIKKLKKSKKKEPVIEEEIVIPDLPEATPEEKVDDES